MLPKRRPPAGLESAASRGPYRIHAREDWSCGLDSEELSFGCGGWQSDLLDDMNSRSLTYLALHYPELTFSVIRSKTKPKGYDYSTNVGQKWTLAKWRTH